MSVAVAYERTAETLAGDGPAISVAASARAAAP